jgi:formate-dependent nitrite reductase membrane component NrfD
VPLALGLVGYTGVLLSTTATPIWARNAWIGPLFSASALSAGASAIGLAEAVRARRSTRRQVRALHRAGMAARAAEAVALAGFLARAGSLAKPVTHGKYAPHLWAGAVGVGVILSTVLEALPAPTRKSGRWMRAAGAVAGLAGGLALRWAITQAGQPSGGDAAAAQAVSRADS